MWAFGLLCLTQETGHVLIDDLAGRVSGPATTWRQRSPETHWVAIVVIALASAIFFVDMLTPRGVAIGAAYATTVLVAVAAPRRSFPIEVAAACSLLTIVGVYASPSFTGSDWLIVGNRVMSLGVIWFVALLSFERGRLNTALRSTGAELRSRAQVLEVMIANLPVTIARVTESDAPVDVHGAALSRLGLSPQAALAQVSAAAAAARRGGDPVHARSKGDVDGRPYWLDHWFVEDAERNFGLLWVCTDVTERLRLDHKLERAAKLAALGELAGNIAHEVNNPVGIISGKARLLVTGQEALPDKVREDLRKIAVQCDRVANLTRRLLGYVRPHGGSREPLDIREPVRCALSLVAAKAQRQGVRLVEELGAEVPTVDADVDELEQVFLNLFLNALDAMPDGGTLRVRAGRDATGRAEVEVRDDGAGMDERTLARMFEPFFTTKADGGTGLGLHICHRIVSDHEGELEGRSSPGGGSTFQVVLPASRAGGPPPSARHDAAAATPSL